MEYKDKIEFEYKGYKIEIGHPGLTVDGNVTYENILKTFLVPIKLDNSSKSISDWLNDFVVKGYNSNETTIEYYRQIKIPTRFVWGIEDTLTPIKDAEVLVQSLRDAKLYRIESVGHMPMIENYEKFDEALIRAILE